MYFFSNADMFYWQDKTDHQCTAKWLNAVSNSSFAVRYTGMASPVLAKQGLPITIYIQRGSDVMFEIEYLWNGWVKNDGVHKISFYLIQGGSDVMSEIEYL